MSDADAPFLAAVIAAPDDDLPRLIFADWLDERGESERAEFIRVQVELARYDAMTFADCPDREYPDHGYAHADDCPRNPKHPLRRREAELLPLAYSRVWGWLSPTDRTREVFRRGFACEITLPAADFLAHAAAVFGAAPVTRVVVSDLEPSRDVTEYPARGPYYLEALSGVPAGGDIITPELLACFPEDCRHQGAAWFFSREEAAEQLSLACVRFGRHAAGLPAWGPAGRATAGSGDCIDGGRQGGSGGPTIWPAGA